MKMFLPSNMKPLQHNLTNINNHGLRSIETAKFGRWTLILTK